MINVPGNSAYISHAQIPMQSRFINQPPIISNNYGSRVVEGAISG